MDRKNRVNREIVIGDERKQEAGTQKGDLDPFFKFFYLKYPFTAA